MIMELWPGVTLDAYNKWFPLTGEIKETPEQYIDTWPKVDDWFKVFALRAQNDINSYLNFVFYKFPFTSFVDKEIKQTIVDMVFLMVEHWVYNHTPIEITVDASVSWNNGQSSFSSTSIPTLNIWDLAPSRMKILARLTNLKQVLMDADESEVDPTLIDLNQFYTKTETNELLNDEKSERVQGDQDNHEFVLAKQFKLYDDVVTGDEKEVFRGPVTKLVNKSYLPTSYDPVTETMILDWPSEIGTLPPEALVPNPTEGDVTHAATADFSAKLQKRVTTNENNIKDLVTKLTDLTTKVDKYINRWVTTGERINDYTFKVKLELLNSFKIKWGILNSNFLPPAGLLIAKETIIMPGWLMDGTPNKLITLDTIMFDNQEQKLLLDFTNFSPDDAYITIKIDSNLQGKMAPYILLISTWLEPV